jgi:hypothetical protein
LKLIIKKLEICIEASLNLRKGIINYGNGSLLADPQSVLNRWKHFYISLTRS